MIPLSQRVGGHSEPFDTHAGFTELTEMLSIAHSQKTVYLQQTLLAALRSGKWRCRSLLMIGFSCILSITIGSNPYLVCSRSSQGSIVTLLQSQ